MEDHAAKLMPMYCLTTVFERLQRAPADLSGSTKGIGHGRTDRRTEAYVAAVSHELRNQLSAIIGSLNLIRGGKAGTIPAETTPMIDMAYRNAVRMSELLTNIMDAEKIAAEEMDIRDQTVNFIDVIRNAHAACRALADEKSISLEIKTDVKKIEVDGDPRRLEQIVLNLLTNAVNFSEVDGKVVIGVDAAATDVRFSVTDHGPGIPVEFQAKVFDMFATCDTGDGRNRRGVGLGLWITKALVEAHSGEIGFVSEPGQTCFWVTLPLSAGAEHKSGAPSLHDPP